jgi:hypothetical protein
MQFHFYRFTTIRVRHWKNVITGRKVADQETEVKIKRNG